MTRLIDVSPDELCENCGEYLEMGKAVEHSGMLFCGDCALSYDLIDRDIRDAMRY